MKTKILKPILFLAILAALMAALGPVFRPKEAAELSQLKGLGEVDYLVVGDSEGWASFQPMEVWRTDGFTGYNLSKPGQRLQDFYADLQTVLETQHPKVLLLETDILYKNLISLTEFEGLLTSTLGELFPFIRYHEQWQTVLPDLSGSEKNEHTPDYSRGAYINGAVMPSPDPDYYKAVTDQVQKMPWLYRYFAAQIVSLCKENNIQLILYSSPSPKNWTYAIHNGLEAFAQEYDLEFIDFNLLQEEIGLDWSADCLDDGDHINFSGSLKVMAYLSEYLAEHTGLTDHRGDPSFQIWDEDLKTYLTVIGQG